MPAASNGETCSVDGWVGAKIGNADSNEDDCLGVMYHIKPAAVMMSSNPPRIALIERVIEAGVALVCPFLISRGGGTSSSNSSSYSSSSIYLGIKVVVPFWMVHLLAFDPVYDYHYRQR